MFLGFGIFPVSEVDSDFVEEVIIESGRFSVIATLRNGLCPNFGLAMGQFRALVVTNSASESTLWKHTMSPSCISAAENVDLVFMVSIMLGLISW